MSSPIDRPDNPLVKPSTKGVEPAHQRATTYHNRPNEKTDEALASVLTAYTVHATFWLLFATGVGLLLAFKFGPPDFWGGAWLTFGRLRPIHTNVTFWGFASPVLIGLAYYVAARGSGTRLHSQNSRGLGHSLSMLPSFSAPSRWIWATTMAVWKIASGRARSARFLSPHWQTARGMSLRLLRDVAPRTSIFRTGTSSAEHSAVVDPGLGMGHVPLRCGLGRVVRRAHVECPPGLRGYAHFQN